MKLKADLVGKAIHLVDRSNNHYYGIVFCITNLGLELALSMNGQGRRLIERQDIASIYFK